MRDCDLRQKDLSIKVAKKTPNFSDIPSEHREEQTLCIQENKLKLKLLLKLYKQEKVKLCLYVYFSLVERALSKT